MLRAAVIGCGAIHKLHTQAITDSEVAQLAVVCDILPQRARETAREYGCEASTSFDEVIRREDIDVVHICTPHYLHAPMAIAAMEHGKDVFSEKPMAIRAEDAQRMLQTAAETGRRLGICFQNRYRTPVREAERILHSGELGRILGARAGVYWKRDAEYYASGEWRGKWETEGGGVLINQSIHTLDMLNWLCGGTRELKAHVDTFELGNVIEVEDTAMVHLRLSSGAAALFVATNTYAQDEQIELQIICENGKLTLGDELRVTTDAGEQVYTEQAVGGEGKSVWGTTHQQIIEDFYTSIREKRPFAVDGSEGIQAIRLLDAIYRSDAQGCYIPVE